MGSFYFKKSVVKDLILSIRSCLDLENLAFLNIIKPDMNTKRLHDRLWRLKFKFTLQSILIHFSSKACFFFQIYCCNSNVVSVLLHFSFHVDLNSHL